MDRNAAALKPAPEAKLSRPTGLFRLRVYYEDTDAAGLVYYANYLRFFERARTEWLRALGFEQSRLTCEEDIAFAARSVAVEYLKPARLDDALNIVSEIESVARAQVVFAQKIERGDSNGAQTLVTATMRIVCISASRMKPVPMPKSIYETFKTLTGRKA